MENQDNINEVKQAVSLLREYLETIRINLEILEVLKQTGRIKDTDKQYIEITELDRKNRKSFNEFIFTELPRLIEADTEPGIKVLKKSFLDWAADLYMRLRYLDLFIKEYMNQMALADQIRNKKNKDPEVKDKRFWKFLDREKSRARLFESFEEPEKDNELDQVPDPEKGKEEQQ
jgi:hypothetical protein